jgi:transcriptional regulator GlxA family with amidase domain
MTDAILHRRLAERPLHVSILLFPDVEVLDFAGPFEVFSVAARINRTQAGHAPFAVSTIAARKEPVRARHGLMVLPACSFADAPAADILIVPGGVMTQPLASPETLAWVKQEAARAPLTASVCTGAFVLAELGLLDGQPATTHWEDIAELRSAYPHLDIRENAPFVDTGAIVTSAGISAGIAMSLHLVGRVQGLDAARATARQMEYDWQHPVMSAQAGIHRDAISHGPQLSLG